MAQNIWNATLDVDNSVKQNPFDWTHLNNLTTQIGRITPVFCDLVPAKTSFRVHQDFGLQLMPMIFPIQTRLRASISWFRYPLRALWKDYKDYVGNFREGLVEPYINLNTEERLKKMVGTGSLGDYLGIPSTYVGNFKNTNNFQTISLGESATRVRALRWNGTSPVNMDWFSTQTLDSFLTNFTDTTVSSSGKPFYAISLNPPSVVDTDTTRLVINFEDILSGSLPSDAQLRLAVFEDNDTANNPTVIHAKYISEQSHQYVFDYNFKNVNIIYLIMGASGNSNTFFSNTGAPSYTVYLQSSKGGYLYPNNNITEISLASSPWYNSLSANKDKQIKLAAYAFRAYEGIYNSMYRDNRNNPYYINGVVQYNQWIPTYDGGEDNNLYELRYANWEKDFLTTSVQSPQQGNAPLVGITTYETGNTLENGIQETRVALVDEDGKRYSIEYQHDGEGLKGVNYVELDNGTVVRSARNLMDLATSGISIPDLRLVNCYQKYLELNMRKGYSYKDIVEGRFDVKVRYADLLLPEFFGGTSRDMNMNAITQTVDQDTNGIGNYKDALGSQAGVGYFTGSSNGNIECFCDEESIIMGLLTITPLPVYTQLLPKHFTYRNLLDHFNPEFNNIGFQPISYKEVCPIQSYNYDKDSLNNTFGYQRPWYEYAQRYDVAHGLFRTQLSNFLMHRVFDMRPELAQSFLLIDPEQVTDVFSVTETTDKVYGQVRLNITCKLPIARVAIPRLD